MATITVRSLSEETKSRLRVRAAQNGRSTEAEVRAILDAAVADELGATAEGLGSYFVQLFADVDTTGFDAHRSPEAPRPVAIE